MKKVKSGPLGDFEKMREKNFKNEICVKNGKCQSAEKCKRETPWDFLTSIMLQNIETNDGEYLWWNPKISKKNRIVSKKIM